MDDKKPAKKPNSANKLEFSGRLDSINVSGAGSHFQFEVAGKNGSKSYLLDSANPPAFAALAAFITSAYMAGKKIHVQGTANGEGLPFASSIRIGAKPKAPKVKPVKRVKGPLLEAQPAAA
jgi:hypothetical protein